MVPSFISTIVTSNLAGAVARKFGVTSASFDLDYDNDGLSNLEELEAYYLDQTSLSNLSIRAGFSDGETPDYFRTVEIAGETNYLGAIFNGGEFIEPDAREALNLQNFDHLGTVDYFTSGWDVWSIVRFSKKLSAEGDNDEESQLGYVRKLLALRHADFEATTLEEVCNYVNKHYGYDYTAYDSVEDLVRILGGSGGLKAIKREIAESTGIGYVAGAAIDAAFCSASAWAIGGCAKSYFRNMALGKMQNPAEFGKLFREMYKAYKNGTVKAN